MMDHRYKLGSCYRTKKHNAASSSNISTTYIKNDDKFVKHDPPIVSQNMRLFVITNSSEYTYGAANNHPFVVSDSIFWFGIEINLHDRRRNEIINSRELENLINHTILDKNMNVE